MSPASPSDPPHRRPPLWLEECYLSREATRTLGRVAPTRAPILCLESHGPSFARLAAAIHGGSRRDRLVLVDLRCARDAILAGLIRVNASPRSTLAIDGIEFLDADGQRALVTSANLTGNALELNMELGLLVEGGSVPGRLSQHFGELIDRGILREMN